ncbi:MAG: MFS transporter [Bacteroidetes bacterium]|nr:MAG: MFS transporter [Bacteroidota bacterium]
MEKQKPAQNNNETFAEDRIKFSQLAAFGSGGIIPIALFNVAGILVGLMGNISLGLSAFWLGVILIIPRLWDAVSDPIIGHLSDNARTRWGRRRPFLLVGGILVAVFFVMMWWIPQGDMVRVWFPSEAGYQAFQLGYILISLLLFFTACTIFEIPHGALGMEMTSDQHVRTRLFSAKSFVGNLFAMSTPWLFALASMEFFRGPGGTEVDGMRYVSLLVAGIIIPLSFWWFFSLREPKFKRVVKQKKTPFWENMKHAAGNKNFIKLTLTIFTLAMGFNFVNLLGSYIPIFYIFGGDKIAGAYLLGINGTVWAVTGLAAVFPLNWISPRLGKRKTLMLAIGLMAAAQISKIFFYNPQYPYLIIIPTMLLSAGMLFFFTLGASMVGDICDEDDLNTGKRTEGSFYSIFWWFIKMGTALASFVAGALIVFTMFDQTQVTRVDAIEGSIREMRNEVQIFQRADVSSDAATIAFPVLETRTAEALDEGRQYLVYLEREAARIQVDSEIQRNRVEFFNNAIRDIQATISGLESLMEEIRITDSKEKTKSLTDEATALTLRVKQIKAEVNAFHLEAHLKTRVGKSDKSEDHYRELLEKIASMRSDLATLNTSISLQALETELLDMEDRIVPLKRQSSYTLLMMRIVEIGLPIILSLFSLFFVMRYSLTEERLQEIKMLLRARNAKRDQQQL